MSNHEPSPPEALTPALILGNVTWFSGYAVASPAQRVALGTATIDGPVPAVRARDGGGVLVQGPRVLPVVHRATHGRPRGAPGGRGAAEEHGDGRLRYRFKRPWRNGTYAVVLEPLDLVARLVALVPPPRFHMLRYHGVLAAHAKARAEVVPGCAASASCEPAQLKLAFEAASESEPSSTSDRASRHPWAWLLARVFAVDVTVCPQCAGRMRLVKLATTREEITKALAHAGLGPRPPPRARPTMLGQLELSFAAA